MLIEAVNNLYDQAEVHRHEIIDEETKATHQFRFANNVPLNLQDQNEMVNVLDYKEFGKDGHILRYWSRVTDIKLTNETVKDLMIGGRTRWSIKNESFNTLKNKGYHLEHNYGHGKKNLATNFACLIILAVLGASNYTYGEALSQKTEDWLGSHERAFAFFGGVPEIVVPDNPKCAVIKACRYEPDLNPSYQHLACHYQVAVIPARPYKPKDKAKAEVGVQVVERWILARLRHEIFFTLAELNLRIRELLTEQQEETERNNKRLARLLRSARFKLAARIHDINYEHPRGLKQNQMASLSGGDWLDRHRNLLITGYR